MSQNEDKKIHLHLSVFSRTSLNDFSALEINLNYCKTPSVLTFPAAQKDAWDPWENGSFERWITVVRGV